MENNLTSTTDLAFDNLKNELKIVVILILLEENEKNHKINKYTILFKYD